MTLVAAKLAPHLTSKRFNCRSEQRQWPGEHAFPIRIG